MLRGIPLRRRATPGPLHAGVHQRRPGAGEEVRPGAGQAGLGDARPVAGPPDARGRSGEAGHRGAGGAGHPGRHRRQWVDMAKRPRIRFADMSAHNHL